MIRHHQSHRISKSFQSCRRGYFAAAIALLLILFAGPALTQTIGLTEGDCFPYPLLPQMYSYSHLDTGWMGVAVVSETGQNVFIEARDGDPGSVLHASQIPGETNFLVHQWTGAGATGYFRTATDLGPVNIQHLVDYDPGQGSIGFGTEYSGNYGAIGGDCGLLRVWDANLVAGNTYELNLDTDAVSGHLEVRAALLQTGGANDWIARADALWETAARENSGLAGHTFTVPTTGTYALVIFRNGYHNLDVWDSDYDFILEDHGGSSTSTDLVVQSILPGTSPENTAFDLDITLRNNGTADSAPCVTTVWIDSALACAGIATPAIAPQQSLQITACTVGPFNAGSIQVLVQVDSDDQVPESDETNNQNSRTINIVAQRPDLIITSVSPTEAVPYHPVTFAVVVSNIGLADAPASETSLVLDFTSPCGVLATPPILSGSSVTVNCQVASISPGYHTLGATADVNLWIPESAETNNSASSYLNALGPDLLVVDFSPRETRNVDPVRFEFVVRNEGNADMPSCYAEIAGDGVALGGSFLIPAIPHGQDVTVTSPWYDPLPAGVTNLSICVDVNHSFLEYDESNNCFAGDVETLVLQATVFPDGHGDYPTIQAAIDAVANGGLVSLAYGTFTGPGNRDLDFQGKDLTVRGTGRTPDRCTIDCQGSSGDPHRAFLFENGESDAAVVENCTIINGWMNAAGGAIRIDGASPTLDQLIFRNNQSHLRDGGAISTSSGFRMSACIFENNHANGEPPTIVAQGGAVACAGNYYTVDIDRCTFIDNQANEASAISAYSGTSGVVLINHSLFVGNSSSQGTIDGMGSIVLNLECSDVWGNSGGDWAGAIGGQNGYDGNISADPLFCDLSGGDYALHSDSPCAEDNSAGCGQIGALGVGCGASGESVYVIQADGSGDFATIQAAINSAHSGDVIELGDGVYSGAGNRDLGFGGKDLIVRSQSGIAAECIIDCGGSSSAPHRAFSFTGGETSAAEVSRITIRYGYHTLGGGVSIVGASPTFTGCVFSTNQAQGHGGALYATTSDSRIVDCEFRLNHASGSGAAAYLSSGSYDIDGNQFSGNSSETTGGGLCFVNCSGCVVESNALFSNTATTSGGGVSVEASQVTFNNCTLDGNTAPAGSGMSCDATAMVQVGSTNVTGNYGGEGLLCHEYTNVVVGCTNLWGNEGGDWVGPVAVYAGSYDNLSVDPQYCSPGVGDYHLNIASPLAPDNNSCGRIGAFGVGCGVQTVIVLPGGGGDFTTIQDAIDASAWGDTIRLGNGVFTGDGNRDLHFDGKAIALLSQSGNPGLCIIDCNASSTDPHRAIDFEAIDGPGVLVSGLTLRNAWKNYGGAVRLAGGNPTIQNCIFENNTSNNGAAIAAANGAGPAISDCTFINNFASNAGGGVHTGSGADPVLVNCTFEGNLATWGGGGLYAYGPCAPSFDHCLFDNNGSDHWGGAFHTQQVGADVQFLSCTFVGNHAPDGGVGFCRGDSHADLDQSILTDSTQGAAIYCSSGGSATLICSNVWGNAGGDWVDGIAGQDTASGNFSADPGYCDPAAGIYSLGSGSPCLPGGNDCAVQIGAFGVGCSSGATVRLVQADGSGSFPTIQAAVDVSYHGDTVLLADGVFTGAGNRDVDLRGLQIHVASESGNATMCIVDCQGSAAEPHRGFLVINGEGPDTVIENLTIANAWNSYGGGIRLTDSSPIIAGCRFLDNAGANGGGIFASGTSAPYIDSCYFTGNSVTNAGGAIRFSGSSGIVENCHFENNYGYWGGGGIYVYLSSVSVLGCLFEENSCHGFGSDLQIQSPDQSVSVEGCTFVGGSSSDGVIRVRGGSHPQLTSCLIAFSQQGQAVSCDATSSPVISCSDIYGNSGGDWVGCLEGLSVVDGNLAADPLFCGAGDGDYQLEGQSPCLPDGNGCGNQIGAFGLSCLVSPVRDEPVPTVATLYQNFPNPFNPSTTIRFDLPSTATTSVRIYDLQGRLVKTLVREVMEIGSHSVVWRGSDDRGRRVASGVYWCRLQSDGWTSIRKMMLLK